MYTRGALNPHGGEDVFPATVDLEIMSNPTGIDRVGYEAEDLEHVQAGEDFRSGTRLYSATITGTLHLYLDGDELRHSNYLPAHFDVIDTAKAQFELLRAIENDGRFSGEPFCCSCGDRGCAYILWEIEVCESGDLRWEMIDLSNSEIGEHEYTCSFEWLRELVLSLHSLLVEFVVENDIESPGEVDEENDYRALSGIEETKRAIKELGSA